MLPYGFTRPQWVNLRRLEFILENMETHLHFPSLIYTKTLQIAEIHF